MEPNHPQPMNTEGEVNKYVGATSMWPYSLPVDRYQHYRNNFGEVSRQTVQTAQGIQTQAVIVSEAPSVSAVPSTSGVQVSSGVQPSISQITGIPTSTIHVTNQPLQAINTAQIVSQPTNTILASATIPQGQTLTQAGNVQVINPTVLANQGLTGVHVVNAAGNPVQVGNQNTIHVTTSAPAQISSGAQISGVQLSSANHVQGTPTLVTHMANTSHGTNTSHPTATIHVPNSIPVMGTLHNVLTGGLTNTVQSSSSTHNMSAHAQPEQPTKILTRTRLQDLVREVDPNEQLDEDVEEILLQMADDFVDSAVNAACLLAKHRKSNTVEVKDLQLHLERNWNMWIPGFGTDELRPYKRSCVTEAHKQRLSLIRKALKKY